MARDRSVDLDQLMGLRVGDTGASSLAHALAVAARLADGGVFSIATAGKPDCYRSVATLESLPPA